MDLAEATSNQFPRQQRMMGGRDSAEMMKNFIRMTNAKRGIEVGVFTGYTTLAFALTVPEDGHIYAIDYAGSEAFNNGNEFTKLGNEKDFLGMKVDFFSNSIVCTFIILRMSVRTTQNCESFF